MIRTATVVDCEKIVELGLKFAEEAGAYLQVPPVEDDVRATLDYLFTQENACILMAEIAEDEIVGVLVACAQPAFWNFAKLYVQELLWYIEPQYRKGGLGREMISAVAEWAVGMGAYGAGFGCLPKSKQLRKLYKSMGLIEKETHFSLVF